MDSKDRVKQEFKNRIYRYILRLVKFLAKLPKNSVTQEIVTQLIRSGTSIGANYFEAQAASSKKDYQNFFSLFTKISQRNQILVGNNA